MCSRSQLTGYRRRFNPKPSRTGMSLGVLLEKMSGIHLGIDLGVGQRSMAEQSLDGPQIGAAGQEMGREGMAQRMRSRRVRQAERTAQAGEEEVDIGGSGRAATNAAKQRLAGRQGERAESDVAIDGFPRGGEDRH